jgi:hypothetical protein
MEKLAGQKPQPDETTQPELTLEQRVIRIESYCGRVDKAFEKLIEELNAVKSLIPIVQGIDTEISNLTGNVMRLTKLEEERYIELATAINAENERVNILNESIPEFVDKKIDAYFEEIAATDDAEEPIDDTQTEPS